METNMKQIEYLNYNGMKRSVYYANKTKNASSRG